jgi:hypothetical protein
MFGDMVGAAVRRLVLYCFVCRRVGFCLMCSVRGINYIAY